MGIDLLMHLYTVYLCSLKLVIGTEEYPKRYLKSTHNISSGQNGLLAIGC